MSNTRKPQIAPSDEPGEVRPLLDGELRDGRHAMPVRVYYEDTDFSGLVYHASYLRFMERGRTNYLRLLGADQRALFEDAANEAPGFAFVVRSMQIEFLQPARMDDVLDVVTEPHEVKGASVVLRQRVMRGDALLIDAQVRVAFVSGGRARPIPKALRAAMRADAENPAGSAASGTGGSTPRGA
jgi:acyl-CoA thioester hydrolase